MKEIQDEEFCNEDDFSIEDTSEENHHNNLSFNFQGDAPSIDTAQENILVREYEKHMGREENSSQDMSSSLN